MQAYSSAPVDPNSWQARVHAELVSQGAEALVYSATFQGLPTIVKERFSKTYRHPVLDEKINTKRLKEEARMMAKARQFGVDTPQLYFIDHANRLLFMERVQGSMVKIELNDSSKTNEDREAMARLVAEAIAKLHDAHIVHGDLTTSNLLLRAHPLPETASSSSPSSLVATVAELNTKHGVVMIDFGLSYTSTLTEDKAVDLYVLERAFLATHPELENLFASILQHYEKVSKFGKDVLRRLDAGSSSLFDITW